MKLLALLGVTPLLILLAACGGPAKEHDGISVIAAFYPFAFVAEQVGGAHIEVSNLTSPGVEPHDVELKPKQVGGVQDADLVIYEAHFQAAVDDAVEQAGRSAKDTVDVDSLVDPLPSQEASGRKGGAADEADPHTWLDPQNMITVTQAVEAKLSAIDPEHAADYTANAAKLVAELRGLESEFVTGLATCRTRTIVTSHAAFQYLAARYDLIQVPIAGVDPANEPSPAQLADITNLVRAEQITTIFTEELVSPAVADTIAEETGATTATLDPIEGLSDATRHETYLTLMQHNLQVLRKANSCS